MPKTMFALVEIEEGSFGKIWRMLDTMPGIVTLSYKSEGVKGQSGNKPGGKKGGAQSSECVVLDVLIRGERPCPRQVLSAALVTAGRKASTIAGVMNALIKKKQVRVVSGRGSKDVLYSVTPAGKKRFAEACQIETKE
jgi:hypothetical protein